MSYCLKTNLSIIDSDTKHELINLARSIPNFKFDFLKLDTDLSNKIIDQLPEYLKVDPDQMFVRLQLINQKKIAPHYDKGRVSGIYMMLSDNTVNTHFYDWKADASKTVADGWISEDQLDSKLTVIFPKNQVWLFDHSAIHSVDYSKSLRISLNILYQYLPYTKLVELYEQNCQIV